MFSYIHIIYFIYFVPRFSPARNDDNKEKYTTCVRTHKKQNIYYRRQSARDIFMHRYRCYSMRNVFFLFLLVFFLIHYYYYYNKFYFFRKNTNLKATRDEEEGKKPVTVFNTILVRRVVYYITLAYTATCAVVKRHRRPGEKKIYI